MALKDKIIKFYHINGDFKQCLKLFVVILILLIVQLTSLILHSLKTLSVLMNIVLYLSFYLMFVNIYWTIRFNSLYGYEYNFVLNHDSSDINMFKRTFYKFKLFLAIFLHEKAEVVPDYYDWIALMWTEPVQGKEGDYNWSEIAVAPGLRNWKYTVYINGT